MTAKTPDLHYLPEGDSRAFMEGREANPEDLKGFNAALKRSPHDLETRAKILGYYCGLGKVRALNKRVYSRHMLWFVENSPRHEALLSATCMCCYEFSSRSFDDVAQSWIKQVDENPLDVTILRHAAAFMCGRDPEKDLEYLRRAEELTPTDPELAGLLMLNCNSNGRHDEAIGYLLKAINHWSTSKKSTLLLDELFHNTISDAVCNQIQDNKSEDLRVLANACMQHEEIERSKYGATYVSDRSKVYNYSKFMGDAILGVIDLLDGKFQKPITLLEEHLKARLTTSDPFRWSTNRAIYNSYREFPAMVDHINKLLEETPESQRELKRVLSQWLSETQDLEDTDDI